MDNDAIHVDWQAGIVPDNGRVIYGRLNRLGERWVEILADQGLPLGQLCNLVLMPPNSLPGEPETVIDGRAVVHVSVLFAMHFHITLELLELKGNGAAYLNDYIRTYGSSNYI